jgi:hypothetical protein
MLRLPVDMLEACRRVATKERRSLNAQLLYMIEEWLQETQEKIPGAYAKSGVD